MKNSPGGRLSKNENKNSGTFRGNRKKKTRMKSECRSYFRVSKKMHASFKSRKNKSRKEGMT